MGTMRTLGFSQDELVGLRMSTVRTLEFSQDELVGLRLSRATNEEGENWPKDSEMSSRNQIRYALAAYPCAC